METVSVHERTNLTPMTPNTNKTTDSVDDTMGDNNQPMTFIQELKRKAKEQIESAQRVGVDEKQRKANMLHRLDILITETYERGISEGKRMERERIKNEVLRIYQEKYSHHTRIYLNEDRFRDDILKALTPTPTNSEEDKNTTP